MTAPLQARGLGLIVLAPRSAPMTTGPLHKPQRPGISSRAPLTHLPPSRSRTATVGPRPGEEERYDVSTTTATTSVSVSAEGNTEYGSAQELGSDLPAPQQVTPPSPLSILPLKTVLRSLFISTVSCSKPLLLPSLYCLSVLATSQNPLLNPDKNPVLRSLIKGFVYAQFCAGESRREVDNTINGLKDLGFSGVILCYAKEAVAEEGAAAEKTDAADGQLAECLAEVTPWAEGTMETITMAQPGDYVALK